MALQAEEWLWRTCHLHDLSTKAINLRTRDFENNRREFSETNYMGTLLGYDNGGARLLL